MIDPEQQYIDADIENKTQQQNNNDQLLDTKFHFMFGCLLVAAFIFFTQNNNHLPLEAFFLLTSYFP